MWGLGSEVLGLGSEVWGLGFEVLGLGLEVLGLGFEVPRLAKWPLGPQGARRARWLAKGPKGPLGL